MSQGSETSQVQSEFESRIGRAVARFAEHAAAEGLDVTELDGSVTLHLLGGVLTGVEYAPATKPAKGQHGRVGAKRSAASVDDLPELDADGHFAESE